MLKRFAAAASSLALGIVLRKRGRGIELSLRLTRLARHPSAAYKINRNSGKKRKVQKSVSVRKKRKVQKSVKSDICIRSFLQDFTGCLQKSVSLLIPHPVATGSQ